MGVAVMLLIDCGFQPSAFRFGKIERCFFVVFISYQYLDRRIGVSFWFLGFK